ncbi:fibroblast growth factor receptor 1-A-like [Xyrauchen texanus]|uniref:fibroblast growth factor receptor 1-A-like n=1 Tax=Xyrauchen texanus TaxID=154827 RepID=UPI0022427059|nr:fibroblast growth factor receptor 1-A-like [Xyrauchen texanus]
MEQDEAWAVASVEPTPFTLYPGEKLELSCKCKEETQEVTWTKDNVPLVDGEHTHLRNDQLEIETVEPADSGLYACFAQGPNSNPTDYFNINVTERSPHRPILQAGLPANRTAVVGSDVEFECKVFSDPQPHIQWLKHIEVNGSRDGPDGLPYVRILKHSGVNSSDTQVLTLYNVTEEESGEYICRVSNYIGQAKQSAWLNVIKHSFQVTFQKRKRIESDGLRQSDGRRCPRRKCVIAVCLKSCRPPSVYN